MSGHAEPRFKKRVPCQLTVEGSAYSGMVLNVSRGGLFVQTSAHALPGEAVRVALQPPAGGDRIEVGARVVWKRVVAAQLRSVTQGGVGLRIHDAPETYYSFLVNVSGHRPPRAVPAAAPKPPRRAAASRPAPAAEPAPPAGRFRVRAKQRGAPRSRTVLLDCATEEEAREGALSTLGDKWIVLEVTRL